MARNMLSLSLSLSLSLALSACRQRFGALRSGATLTLDNITEHLLQFGSRSSSQEQKVAVLLCTKNGERFLTEQLESISSQSHANWDMWVSDDGSTDDTLAILETYRGKCSDRKFNHQLGPSKGFASNFLSLVSDEKINADYFAYSDQDDIWEEQKLSCALEWLKTVPENIPGLYCGRTTVVDRNNKHIGYSPLFDQKPSFANSLVQNIGGGNTMVFNKAARNILLKAGNNMPIVSHDWWTYILITGCGGEVYYDPIPFTRYRQHCSNLVGINNTWTARFYRMQMLWKGRFKTWNDVNIAALCSVNNLLTQENLETLNRFIKAREMSLIPRLFHLKRSGVYRQTLFGNLGLIAAAVFNKI